MGNGVSIQSEITKPVDCSDLKSDCDARAEVYRLRKLMRDNQQLIISANTGGRLTSINTNVPPSSANKGISSKGTPTSIKSPTNVDFSRFDRDGNKDFKLANAPSLYDCKFCMPVRRMIFLFLFFLIISFLFSLIKKK